jgi:replicative DNA helicase
MNPLLSEQQALWLIIQNSDIPFMLSIEPQDFTDPRLRKLYKTAREIYDQDGYVDMIKVSSNLNDEQTTFLFTVMAQGDLPSPSLGKSVFKILREARAVRECDKFDKTDFSPEQLPAAMIDHGMKLAKLIDSDKESIEQVKEMIKNPPAKVPTGVKEMDELLGGGITPTSLCILAAKSGSGKTYMAAKFAAEALRQGKTVHFTSLEMPSYQVHNRIMKGAMDKDVKENVDAFMNYGDRLIIQDRKSSINDVLGDMHRNATADLFIVDYLGLVKDKTHTNKVIELGSTSRSLKSFALFHRKPVLCLHQINRDSVRNDRQPRCHDLRGSGEIEENADEVMFLWNEKEHSGSGRKSMNELLEEQSLNDHFCVQENAFEQKIKFYVDKNRHGAEGEVEVLLDYRIGFLD